MITRETIIDEIQKIPESYLTDIYKMIKDFEASKKPKNRKPSLMSKLRSIKISTASDFSQTADLYVSGESK